jgi:hypothetical protein
MIIYNIQYQTENTYECPVNEAYLNFLIMPLETDDQHCSNIVVNNSLSLNPHHSKSLYGANMMCYRLLGSFTSFSLTMNVQVEKRIGHFPVFKNISVEEEQKILLDDYFKLKNEDFIMHTKLTDAGGIELPKETMRLSHESIFKYVQRINTFVQSFLSYQTNVTDTKTSVREIVKLRKGVCQDYAHFFIAIMRLSLIPARYVSGYLSQGQGFIGAAAMHAWVEVYIPETGWIGIDPTNNRFVNESYIKVAHGSDYIDCMPVKGVYRSMAGGTTSYSVEIQEKDNQQ